MTYRILCCDGGGIRGLITALLIQNLKGSFTTFLDRTDGFAGTSTGGLIALGLARDVGIDEIVTCYKTKGEEIFTPNGWFRADAASAEADDAAALAAGPGKFVCQYKSDGLKKVAEGLLGAGRLSDAPKFIAVNAAQLWNPGSDAWEARTLSNTPNNAFREVSMVDAALATSAAPTYFPPHEISRHLGYFADGGVFANNPAMTAVGEALGSGLVDKPADIRVLSLGTGRNPQGIPPSVFDKHKPLNWGATTWLWPAAWGGHVPAAALLALMMDATSESSTTVAEHLLGENFCRANVELDKPYAMDDYKDIGILEDRTADYVKGEAWRKVRDWVEENWI